MKAITREWLAKADEDLAAAQALLAHPELTNIVAFHAQQAVEKALKAALEELELGPLRTHSLTRLYASVRPYYAVIADLDMLDRLEAVYIEARYPGERVCCPAASQARKKRPISVVLPMMSLNACAPSWKTERRKPRALAPFDMCPTSPYY